MGNNQGRIAGLDAWRAVLMLGGLLVHGSFWLPDAPLFAIVTTVSQAFRMGAFFAIAGFLSARAITSRSPGAWLWGRLVQLGVPFAFGVTVLSPMIWLAGRCRPAGAPGELFPPFHWHHLWFLIGLILYSVVAFGLLRIERCYGLVERLVAAHGHRRVTTRTIFGIVTVSSIVLMALAQSAIPHRFETRLANAHFIAAYLPVFVFGMTLGIEPRLREAFTGCWRGYATALGLVAAIYILWFGIGAPLVSPAAADRIGDALRYVGIGVCPTAAFIVILRSALAVKRVPPLLRELSDASYSIYLLHLPIIGVFNAQLTGCGWHPYLQYAAAIAVAFAASYAIHRYAVRRSRTLAILLNGKAPRAVPGLLSHAAG